MMSEFTLDGHLWETERQLPLVGNKLKIYIMQEDNSQPTQRQLEILESLVSLPDELRQDIANHAVEYYRQVDSVVNRAEESAVIDNQSIAKHYALKSILIPEIRNCETNFFFISADCDWEEEHGMQVLVGDAQVISCGDHSTLPFSSQWKNVIAAPRETCGELLKRYLA